VVLIGIQAEEPPQAPAVDPFSDPPAKESLEVVRPDPTAPRDPFAAPPPAAAPAREQPARTAAIPVARLAAVDAESSAATDQIESRLDTQAFPFDYLDQPLTDVLADIAFSHNVPLLLDRAALEDAGIDPSQPISLNLKGVSLRSALRLLLRPLGLDFIIRDETLQVTSREVASRHCRTRIYRVASILGPQGDGDALVELVTTFVEPESWQATGGPGAAMFLKDARALAVRQTEDVLFKVDELLSAIGKLSHDKLDGRPQASTP